MITRMGNCCGCDQHSELIQIRAFVWRCADCSVHGDRKTRTDKPKPGQMCEWFLLCTNQATVFVSHPVLGPVPTCDKCADWYEKMGQKDIQQRAD